MKKHGKPSVRVVRTSVRVVETSVRLVVFKEKYSIFGFLEMPFHILDSIQRKISL
jgi:hypothetical protein